MFRELYQHMEWADAIVWRAVLAHPAAADDATLREKLMHIHMVQRAFLSVWRGQGPDFRETFENVGDLARWGRDYHAEVRRQLDAIDDAARDRPMNMPWADRFAKSVAGRAAATTTLGETMTQVVMHSGYHRGQVNARLRELGGEPPLTDYIAWIWIGKPAAEWP